LAGRFFIACDGPSGLAIARGLERQRVGIVDLTILSREHRKKHDGEKFARITRGGSINNVI
jgi:hypothetical protein